MALSEYQSIWQEQLKKLLIFLLLWAAEMSSATEASQIKALPGRGWLTTHPHDLTGEQGFMHLKELTENKN